MTEFNYEDIIEYIDCTYDEHFESARNWAYSHDTTFEELTHMRDLPKRYFQIGPEPETPKEPTIEELQNRVRMFRDVCFKRYVDWYQSKPLLWEELSDEERNNISSYRIYLKDYTNNDNWWLQNPLEYDEWLETLNS